MRCVRCDVEIEQPDPDLGPEQLCEPCFEWIDKRMAPVAELLADDEVIAAIVDEEEREKAPPWG
jgi:hypothetical protein